MNEKDLFRGKRDDNMMWVIGDLLRAIDGTPVSIRYFKDRAIQHAKIDPGTIGQCTGLKDKRKKLIFDGDIVKMYFEFYGYYAIAEWDRRGSWVCRIPNFGKNGGHTLIRQFNYFDKSGDCFNVEIIGNIYDNPEIFGELNLERSVE